MKHSTRPALALTVRIPIGGQAHVADLSLPANPDGLVLFAHGSGSSRLSPRNRYVAGELADGGFATLLFDLLSPAEERIDLDTRVLRFDVDMLAERLVLAMRWATKDERLAGLPVGLFGASTGAAAALIAAAAEPRSVGAVVSRGGRPDLAGQALEHVRAPTLLVVGGQDHEVIELNRLALSRLTATKRLAIVPGATHLFEEPGALEEAARLARSWFDVHLAGRPDGL